MGRNGLSEEAAGHANLWLDPALPYLGCVALHKCFDLRIKFPALENNPHQMAGEGKMAGLRTAKRGTVTECPHRNVFMSSSSSTLHSSLEVKTARRSVDTEISGMWPLHRARYCSEGGAPTCETALEDAPTSRKQPNAEDNIHGFVYMRLSEPVKTQRHSQLWPPEEEG